ncbi:MAG: sulfatase [Myxococcota bacterium]|jgi:arylsulfatase A-like enzyme|nr:sulfatase [Myxococcota bacterium]
MASTRSFVLALLLCVCWGTIASAEPRPNILLLMAEDLSARIGAFGDPVASTPHIDALARDGVRFPNTFTTAGVCAPSRAAHILGMHQISTGTQHMRSSSDPAGGYVAVPPAHAKAYPELLRASGYYTTNEVKHDYQFSGVFTSAPFPIFDSPGSADWSGRAEGQPFFAFVNLMETHESGLYPRLFEAWPRSVTTLGVQLMRLAIGHSESVTNPADVAVPPYFPDTPTVRAAIARHYDNIHQMDARVGEWMERLRDEGLLEETVVVFTTDHGDALPRAKRELYDSGIRVPMIVRWPERLRPPEMEPGSEDLRLVSFVDFAPTFLRWGGVEAPTHMHGRDFIKGPGREYVFASRDRIDEVFDRQRAVRDGRYKLIRSDVPDQPGGHRLEFRDKTDMMRELHALHAAGELTPEQRLWFEPPGEERLFDLEHDPHELVDHADDPAHAETLARLRAALDKRLAQIGDWSEEPEAAMKERMVPGGEVPETAAPTIQIEAGRATMSCATAGASIGFRLAGGDWRVYRGPVPVRSGQRVEAKALRYGWEESAVASARVAP